MKNFPKVSPFHASILYYFLCFVKFEPSKKLRHNMLDVTTNNLGYNLFLLNHNGYWKLSNNISFCLDQFFKLNSHLISHISYQSFSFFFLFRVTRATFRCYVFPFVYHSSHNCYGSNCGVGLLPS